MTRFTILYTVTMPDGRSRQPRMDVTAADVVSALMKFKSICKRKGIGPVSHVDSCTAWSASQ